MEKEDPFGYLAFVLQFAPATGPAAVEVPRRDKLARIGIEAGKPFPTVALTTADKAAMAEGIKQAEPVIKPKIETSGQQVNGWVNSIQCSWIGVATTANGPIYTVLRMYWPKEAVLNGSWEPPGMRLRSTSADNKRRAQF